MKDHRSPPPPPVDLPFFQNPVAEDTEKDLSEKSAVAKEPRRSGSIVLPNPDPQPDHHTTVGTYRPGADEAFQENSQSWLDMESLVRALVKYNASDLHLKPGRPPLYRINGKLLPAKMPALTAEQVKTIIYQVLSPRQTQDLESKLQIDMSFSAKDLGRFRCNVYFQKGTLAGAIRMIPFTVPRLDDLKVPSVLKDLAQRPRGLLLITGSTGCGKSTTLAALVQHINESARSHILCIEDPIEFLHRDIKATVTQREVGSDTHSIEDALYAGLRQDPDVIVIGEMRDYKMMQAALTAAETGHLVLSTMHTNDAASTIERILDVFPPSARDQARIQLASTLVGVVSQHLMMRADGNGRIPACEILINSPSIHNHILKNELSKIPDAIKSSNNYYKMQTLNQHLEHLIRQGVISFEEALKASLNPEDLKLSLGGISREPYVA